MDNSQGHPLSELCQSDQERLFRQALVNTVKFTFLAVAFEMVIGLLIALFVHGMRRGKKVMRTLLLLPYLLPTVTVALSWRMMLP
jgi:multiple sugar transport system permease protein